MISSPSRICCSCSPFGSQAWRILRARLVPSASKRPVESLKTTIGNSSYSYRAGVIYCTRDTYAPRDGWPYLQDWTEIVEVTERRIEPPWRADPEKAPE